MGGWGGGGGEGEGTVWQRQNDFSNDQTVVFSQRQLSTGPNWKLAPKTAFAVAKTRLLLTGGAKPFLQLQSVELSLQGAKLQKWTLQQQKFALSCNPGIVTATTNDAD